MPVISKLLVAGRGEIALRIMRTARELDIATVAVYSDPDEGEPFAAAADEAVRLPGAAPADTYLRGDAIIAAARATGAQAIHPGYGFLSENAGFARDCAAAGLIFVGPSPEAIEAMGSKVAAKEVMAAAGVPVLPGLTVPAGGAAAPGALAEAAAGIGYPLLVKAAFGGGGRGMRIVDRPDELAEAVASASREAASAFGDGTVFLERYIQRPRHVELQIIGDSHGTVAHLFERECSIQRRYQKIIEEAPSPAVDEDLRERLTGAALTAGRAIGYCGAGTVEFVLEETTGSFWFLEMNTRLQVEHPVTELITGLDLVAVQLAVAEGQPLPPSVTQARISGHAIEARLYAEDPTAGYHPATGTVHRFAVPGLPGVRVDAGIADGSVVGTRYDPMLAKIIAHGATRGQACRRLARALAEARVHGVTTNRDLLAAILREPEFRAGQTDTGYLTRHDPAELGAPPGGAATDLHAAAAALAGQAARRAAAPVLGTVPSGWRNVAGDGQVIVYEGAAGQLEVRYQLGRHGTRIAVNGRELPGVTVHRAAPGEVDLTAGGVRRRVSVHQVGAVAYVDSPLGSSVLTEVPRFPQPEPLMDPGSLLAPMPGTVVRIAVEPGEMVAAGTPVVVIEAMKMEHAVRAPAAGVVAEVGVQVGQAVDTGTPLARVEPKDPEGEGAADE
ncbi:MAG: biotin carboxylase N-terminal domain-containing protein [Gemmatimonadota bacterium]